MSEISEFRGDYGFLSNFHYYGFIWHGYRYPTAEHAFQAAKTLDPGISKSIRGAGSPKMAKHFGRECELRPGWEDIKEGIMLDILFAKFADAELGGRLIETGELKLVEGNYWHDNYWGLCLCKRCDYKGQNRLGKLLMKVREVLTSDRSDAILMP